MKHGRIVEFVDSNSFVLLPVVASDGSNFRPIAASEQDQIDAFEDCRRGCSTKQINMCELNGTMPGMPGCRKNAHRT